MSEVFLCRGERVHFSNGATESLFECWKRLAQEDAGRPGMAAVAACLRERLANYGDGCRSFGMDPEFLPDELAGPNESAALLAVVERTVADPTLVPEVNWSPELLAWWRRQLARMAEALRDSRVDQAEPGATAQGGT